MRSSLTSSVSGVQRCGGCSKHHPLCCTARKIQPCGVSRFPADASGVRTVTRSTPRDEGCEAGVERRVCSAPRPLPSCATVACAALARWTRPLCCGANAVAGRAHTTGRGCVGRSQCSPCCRHARGCCAGMKQSPALPLVFSAFAPYLTHQGDVQAACNPRAQRYPSPVSRLPQLRHLRGERTPHRDTTGACMLVYPLTL